MGKLRVYNFVTLNGYFKGADDDISWAKNGSKEEQEFAGENAKSDGILLFGRKTYEMMAAYWPSENAKMNNAAVADGMNKAEKIVVSKKMKKADWSNTRIINEDLEKEIKKLKKLDKDITILGSGTIVTQLAEAGLIDEYQIMIYPVVTEKGTSLLKDIHKDLALTLVNSRVFKSGAVFLHYVKS